MLQLHTRRPAPLQFRHSYLRASAAVLSRRSLLRAPNPMALTTQLPRGERATNATHHPQAIVKGLVDDQIEAGIVSQIIFLAVGGFFTFVFLALAVP